MATVYRRRSIARMSALGSLTVAVLGSSQSAVQSFTVSSKVNRFNKVIQHYNSDITFQKSKVGDTSVGPLGGVQSLGFSTDASNQVITDNMSPYGRPIKSCLRLLGLALWGSRLYPIPLPMTLWASPNVRARPDSRP